MDRVRFYLIAFILLSECAWCQSSNVLIGVENTGFRSVRDDLTGKFVVTDSERTVFNNFGTNFVLSPHSTKHHPTDPNIPGPYFSEKRAAVTQVLDWADDNGGYPKMSTEELADSIQLIDNWKNSGQGYYWTETGSTPDAVAGDIVGFAGWGWIHPIDFHAFLFRRPQNYGMGGTAESNFKDTVTLLLNSVGGNFANRSGYRMLRLGTEQQEWRWRDTAALISYDHKLSMTKYPCRVFPDTAEAAAKRWRQGLNYICTQMKGDSRFDSTKSLYYDGEAFAIGYGGNPLNYANWDSIVWYQQYIASHYPPANPDPVDDKDFLGEFFSGLDGVPDTLARLGEYFSDMAKLDYYLIQWDPYKTAIDSNVVGNQRQHGHVSHSWRAFAAGLASARNTARSFLRTHTTHTDSLAHPIPVTKLIGLNQGSADWNPVKHVFRYPTRVELEDQANIGFACGITLPVYYVYDMYLGDSAIFTEIRLPHTNPSSRAVQYNINDTLYYPAQWVNNNIIKVFAPIMDTLEYYNGLTTRFGTRYGDTRPYGGDYSNGWHIKGHEYLDSIITKNGSGIADSISHDTTISGRTKGSPVFRVHGTYVDVGFFHPKLANKNDVDTTREYLYVLNRRTDSGGERYITSVFSRTSRPAWKCRPYLRVHDMTANTDTILRWHGDTVWFTRHYDRAEGKLFSLFEDNDIAGDIPVSDDGVSFNNGVHAVRHDSAHVRVVFVRNDSLFTKIVSQTDCGSPNAEALIAAGGKHASCTPGDTSWMRNRHASVARHRKANEDMVLWEHIDSVRHLGVLTGVSKFIYAAVVNDANAIITVSDPTQSDTCLSPKVLKVADAAYLSGTTSFLAAPVVCGADRGWIASWSDSMVGIRVEALAGSAGTYWTGFNILTLPGPPAGLKPAQFSSISWGTDTVASATMHLPIAHVVWQQPDNAGFFHIYHRLVEGKFTVSSPTYPSVDVVALDTTERVSLRNNWICSNIMPSIAVDAQGKMKLDTPNVAHIMYQSEVMNDSLTRGRIDYVERIYPNRYTPFRAYASGARNYLAPHVVISPKETDALNTSLMLAWYSDLNSMHAYLPGDVGTLRRYPIDGKHPTLSYSIAIDSLPITLFQTPQSAFYAQTASHKAIESATQVQTKTRQVNSVAVEGQHAAYISCGSCCGVHGFLIGITASSGLPTGTYKKIGIMSVPPIPLPGNGTVENTLVQSTTMALHQGVPLKVERALVAKDSAMLTALTLGGHTVQGLIELMDSTTNSVLAILDSATIHTYIDSVEHKGIITYMPQPADTVHPTYVRARIVADTSLARWSVTAETFFETPDTVGSGGFAKQAMHYFGRAGLVPEEVNPINLTVFPNPFNPKTQVAFTVPLEDAEDLAEVKIFDMQAKDVSTLVHEIRPAGRYTATFDATNLPSGRYIVAVHLRNHMQSKLMVLTR